MDVHVDATWDSDSKAERPGSWRPRRVIEKRNLYELLGRPLPPLASPSPSDAENIAAMPASRTGDVSNRSTTETRVLAETYDEDEVLARDTLDFTGTRYSFVEVETYDDSGVYPELEF